MVKRRNSKTKRHRAFAVDTGVEKYFFQFWFTFHIFFYTFFLTLVRTWPKNLSVAALSFPFSRACTSNCKFGRQWPAGGCRGCMFGKGWQRTPKLKPFESYDQNRPEHITCPVCSVHFSQPLLSIMTFDP